MLFPLELSANNPIKIFVEFEQFIGKRFRARKKSFFVFLQICKRISIVDSNNFFVSVELKTEKIAFNVFDSTWV